MSYDVNMPHADNPEAAEQGAHHLRQMDEALLEHLVVSRLADVIEVVPCTEALVTPTDLQEPSDAAYKDFVVGILKLLKLNITDTHTAEANRMCTNASVHSARAVEFVGTARDSAQDR